MSTFTIQNRDGYAMDRGCSIKEAAKILLENEGYTWDVVPMRNGGFELMTSMHSLNSGHVNSLSPTAIFSLKNDRSAAEIDIFQQVISGIGWKGHTTIEDDKYNSMLDELAK